MNRRNFLTGVVPAKKSKYVIGYNHKLRAQHQRRVNIMIRKIVDDAAFRMMTK